MGPRARLIAIAFLSLVVSTTGGYGVADAQQQPAQGRHVAVSLIAETRSIVPGRSFHVALRQQIEAGWHTYWLNPGDSGLPTKVDWSTRFQGRANSLASTRAHRVRASCGLRLLQ